jgi:hypothetical protein
MNQGVAGEWEFLLAFFRMTGSHFPRHFPLAADEQVHLVRLLEKLQIGLQAAQADGCHHDPPPEIGPMKNTGWLRLV